MAKILEARWVGPSSMRKDGPEHQIFRRNEWEQVTPKAAAYFRRFSRVWEVREKIVIRKGRPRKKVVSKPVAISQPEKVVESASGLGGSAIEEEPPDQGFVAVPVDREEGVMSEPESEVI